jgi:hypothetical protein
MMVLMHCGIGRSDDTEDGVVHGCAGELAWKLMLIWDIPYHATFSLQGHNCAVQPEQV